MQRVVRISPLPENALQASAEFYRDCLNLVNEDMVGNVASLVIVFPPAAYDHKDWRRAAIADLAREFAPLRINGIAGEDGEALQRVLAWLDRSPGVTGQLLGMYGQPEEYQACLPDG